MGRRPKRKTPPPLPPIPAGCNQEMVDRHMLAWRLDVLFWQRWGETRKPIMKLMNVSAETVSAWRAGRRTPKLDEIASFAREFGLTMDFLYTGSTIGLDDATLARLSAIGLTTKR